MVKRDTSFVVLFWLRRCAGILLMLWVPALISALLWTWSSASPATKLGLLFFIWWSVPLALSLLRMPKQQQRIESLRMRSYEAPLFAHQPALDGASLPLPIVLSLKLSWGVYKAFVVFWLSMLGIVLLFQVPSFQRHGILWWFLLAWLLLGALVIGLAALAVYQRIEATDEGFTVQHGRRRKHILWAEARLFAVLGRDGQDNSRAGQYELSSSRAILRWTHGAPGVGFVLQPRNRQEYQQLLENLRACVRARTDLMLLDLR